MTLAGAVLLACASDANRPAAVDPAGTAGGSAEPAPSEPHGMVAVTGRVVATGSEPFVILVIVTEANEQYELVGERADPLRDLQQPRVTVRGREVRKAAGPGFPAQLRVSSYTRDTPRR